MQQLKFTSTLIMLLVTVSMVAIAGAVSGQNLPTGVKAGAGIEFVALPAGSFLMGADLDPKYIVAGKDNGWRSIFIQDEFPPRSIKLTHPFEISKYEITNAQYEKFDPSHKSWRGKFRNISDGDNEAVISVRWDEAWAFTSWL